MNSKQIENVLLLIDGNIAITQTEATNYVRDHQSEIVASLSKTGTAVVRTSAGDLVITLDDLQNLEAVAA